MVSVCNSFQAPVLRCLLAQHSTWVQIVDIAVPCCWTPSTSTAHCSCEHRCSSLVTSRRLLQGDVAADLSTWST